jgi:hypothetical protein
VAREVVPHAVDPVGDGPAGQERFGSSSPEIDAGWHDPVIEGFETEAGAS